MSISSINAPRRRLTETEFCLWLGRATSGDILQYHLGFLALDIARGASHAPDLKALRQLARRAAWASDHGLVHLVQRRCGPGNFAYLAIRRPWPRATAPGRACPPPPVADREPEAA